MGSELVPVRTGEVAGFGASAVVPALVAAGGERAAIRFLEFFAGQIRNANTRAAYGRAAGEFLAWCEDHGIGSLADVQPPCRPPGSSS